MNIKKFDSYHKGQIVPLCALFASGFFAFLFFSSAVLLKSTNHFVDKEKYVQEKMSQEFINANALNDIANDNRRIYSHIRTILKRFQRTISRGDSLSGAALIWELDLPIPRPYNVTHSLDTFVATQIATLRSLAQKNEMTLRKLKPSLRNAISKLDFIQSACGIQCLQQKNELISGETCANGLNYSRKCQLNLDNQFITLTSGDRIALKEILTDELQNVGGFILLDTDKMMQFRNRYSQDMIENEIQIETVHPRMCAQKYSSLSLPCLPKVRSATGIPSTVHFEPHWSVSVEFKSK